MSLSSEKPLIFGWTVILIVLGGFAITLILREQVRSRVLHPGWILVVPLLFYALPVPLTLLAAPELATTTFPAVFLRNYEAANFVFLMKLFALSLGGFLYGQVLVNLSPKRQSRPSSGLIQEVLNCRMINRVVIVVAAIGVALIIKRFDDVGGYLNFLRFASRREVYHLLSQQGDFVRYQFLFQTAFGLMTLRLLRTQTASRGMVCSYIGALFAYCVFTLLGGTRLEVLVLLVEIIFLVYALRKEWLKRYRVPIVLGLAALMLFMLAYGTLRNSLRQYLAGNPVAWSQTQVSLFPTEALTGYIPGLVILSADVDAFRYHYLLATVPRTVLSLAGLDKEPTVSRKLGLLLRTDGQSVYTVTLPTDAFLGLGSAWAVFAVSTGLYLACYYGISVLSRHGFMGLGAAAILYSNLYYVVRVEIANWFARVWQVMAVYALAVILYRCLNARAHRGAMSQRNEHLPRMHRISQ